MLSMRLRLPSALLVLALLAAPLAGVADATEVLKLKNGDMVPGEVVELDDSGVHFARQAGGKIHVRWSAVLPVSRYELWASTLEADDAAGLLELARWTAEAELFHQARREAQKVKGVGDDEQQKAASRLLARIDELEADAALAAIDAKVEEGDVEGALDKARRYLRVAPPGAHADRVRGRVPDLLVRLEQAEAAEAERQEDAATERDLQRKQAWIESNLGKALATKEKAQETSIEAYAYLAKGNQTRSRRALAKAEKGFVTSRDLLKKVRRAAGPGEIAEQCQREMEDADRRMLDLLTRWGNLEVGNKAWKKANSVVDRGLRIDPVDPALLDLRRQIDEGWIRRRVSDFTNAEPR
jgi:tetratricopeptide (TPR) repeat protein